MRAAQTDVAALVGNGGSAVCLVAETGLRGFDAAFDAAVKLYVGVCSECGGGKCGSEEKFQVHGLSFFGEELCDDCIGLVRKQVTILAKSDRSFDDALFTRRRCANGVVHRPRNQYFHHEAPCPRGGRTRGGLGVAARILAADGQKRYGQAGICRAFGRWTRWRNLPHPFSDGLKRNGKGMRRGVVWRYGSAAKPKRWQGDEHDAGV